LSVENNNETSMNSVYLETFRKRKNGQLAAEINADEDTEAVSKDASGNSVFLDTFRKRKNKLLASEINMSDENTYVDLIDNASEPKINSELPLESIKNDGQTIESDFLSGNTSHRNHLPIDNHTVISQTAGVKPVFAVSTENKKVERAAPLNNQNNTSDVIKAENRKTSRFRSSRAAVTSDNQSNDISGDKNRVSAFSETKTNHPEKNQSSHRFNSVASDKPKEKKPTQVKKAKAAIGLSMICISLCAVVLFFNSNHTSKSNDRQVLSVSSNTASISDMTKSAESTEYTEVSSSASSTTSESTTEYSEETTTTTQAVEYKALRPGSENDDVLKMQKRLAELGYITQESCTGYYGDYTKRRLKVFQRNAGLKETGNADVKTLKRLYADDAPRH